MPCKFSLFDHIPGLRFIGDTVVGVSADQESSIFGAGRWVPDSDSIRPCAGWPLEELWVRKQEATIKQYKEKNSKYLLSH